MYAHTIAEKISLIGGGKYAEIVKNMGGAILLKQCIDHCAIPCVYGILPNKNRAAYVRLLEAIRDNVGMNWHPIRIMSNFELAAISTSTEVFPDSVLSGCLYHFGQALYRLH